MAHGTYIKAPPAFSSIKGPGWLKKSGVLCGNPHHLLDLLATVSSGASEIPPAKQKESRDGAASLQEDETLEPETVTTR